MAADAIALDADGGLSGQSLPSFAPALDPEEAIDVEAHLMSDLIRLFGSPELALAAYNAGPAPVEACPASRPIRRPRAFVTRILALIGGAGALWAPSFEVRLVAERRELIGIS